MILTDILAKKAFRNRNYVAGPRYQLEKKKAGRTRVIPAKAGMAGTVSLLLLYDVLKNEGLCHIFTRGYAEGTNGQ
jgi:hypothetical protein